MPQLSSRLVRWLRPEEHAISRRELMASALAGAAGVLLSRSGLAAARARAARGADGGKKVVVIGAGLAGLSCAYELRSVGYDVTVVEARGRLGGRVVSFDDFVPGRTIEGGGEFIGSNHPTWINYADVFKLDLVEHPDDEKAEPRIVLGDRLITRDAARELLDGLEALQKRLNTLADPVVADTPWMTEGAKSLDHRALGGWLRGIEVPEEVRALLGAELTADLGVDLNFASLLAMLTCIKGGGVESFWRNSEDLRCAEGTQGLARRLAERIGNDRVLLNLAVSEVRGSSGRRLEGGSPMRVSFQDGRKIDCDDVVLTAPPSVWSKITFFPVIPPSLRPQMGTNVKYITHTRTKFWVEAGLLPEAWSDGPVQETWDASNNKGRPMPPGTASPGPDGCLMAFAGGPGAEKCLSWSKDERDEKFAAGLAKLFPGYRDQVVETRFMDWPRDPWTRASYSFPSLGQVTGLGPAMALGLMPDETGHARLHLAGEYACHKFVGYMEGALTSGVGVAQRLAQRDGVAP